jgi:hypothetical protein
MVNLLLMNLNLKRGKVLLLRKPCNKTPSCGINKAVVIVTREYAFTENASAISTVMCTVHLTVFVWIPLFLTKVS